MRIFLIPRSLFYIFRIKNLQFLMTKVAGSIIRITPVKLFFINVMSFLFGIISFCFGFRQWKAIYGFARHTGSTIPGWRYLLKYFMQRGRDGVWGTVFFENDSSLEKYMNIINREGLQEAIDRGPVILLGAHYGPTLYAVMLHKININMKVLVSSENYNYLNQFVKHCPKFLISKKVTLLKDSYLIAGKLEKRIVLHLREGGVVGMYMDFLDVRHNAIETDFLGMTGRFNYFPFKLAIKYNARIFFHIFKRDAGGGYNLCLVPCGEFKSPEEGVQRYASFFQSEILSDPFMWHFLPGFYKWFSEIV